MYQIDNSTAAVTQPASTAQGTPGWFTDGNAAGGVAATVVPAEWFNAVQAELCNVVEAAGLPLTKNKFSQVAQAIQSGKLSYGTDAGIANAYIVSLQLPLGALFTGLVVKFQAAHTNTGGSTLNVSGLGASPIYGGAHSALQGGEIVAGGFIEVTWNATLNAGAGAWVLLEQSGGAIQVAPATQSQHAMQLGQAVGRLLNIQTFTSSGTYTPTAGTTSIIVHVIGGGGGSGGAPATSSTQQTATAGGSGGAYSKSRITSAFSGLSVTVGAGGSGGAAGANAGQQGGTSSFGSLVTAPGGPGSFGGTLIASTTSQIAVGGGSSGVGIANIYAAAGQVGNFGLNIGSSTKGGVGGANGMGGFGNDGMGGGLAPSTPSTYGAGASGVSNVPSASAIAGGNGKSGIVIIEEYA